MLLSESTRHRTRARSTPDECGHATCGRYCGACEGGDTRLAHVDLLKRCTLGKTQNANESFHYVVWSKCPKMTLVGLQRVVSATCCAVSKFNAGIKVTMANLCEVMQVPPGAHLLASVEKADRLRLQQARRQTLAASKEARQARLVARTRAAAATSTDYAAGEF